MKGPQLLCSARIQLLEGDGDERERLRLAAGDFLTAYASAWSWPVGARYAAERLRAKLTAGGSVDATIDRMGDEAVRDVSDELWRFCEIAEPCPWDGPGSEVRGLEHLREARGALYGEDGDVRHRLRAAAHRFWSAATHIDTWPTALRAKAEAVSARLFRHGGIDDSVRRMGEKTAGEISRDLLGLCDAAEGENSSDDAPPVPSPP